MAHEPKYVLAVGDLVHGGQSHALAQSAVFAGRGWLRAVGYQVAGNQRLGLHVRNGGDGHVGGELYVATPELLAALDAWHGGQFQRKVASVSAGADGGAVDAWVHVFTGAWAGLPLWPGGAVPQAGDHGGPTAWYFGYASNMFHMAERRKLTIFEHALGQLDGWQIAFAKDSGNGQHNYATLLPKRGGRVQGALYRMKQAELEGQLDPQEKEGWHLVRRTFEVRVTAPFAGQPLQVPAPTQVFADAYICLPRWWFWGRISHPANTEKIVPGARLVGLDPDYVAWLEQFCNTPSNPDDYDLDIDPRV